MTTATLRNEARMAAEYCDWAEAAELYQAAHDRYPEGPGELQANDRQALADQAERYRRLTRLTCDD